MGKKARKTRWRTLSIGEGPSDTESQPGDGAKPQGPRIRWGSGGSAPGAQQRYTSSHSTPTRHHNHRPYHSQHSADSGAKWGPAGRALHANASTRSSSTASDTKITFNEDEYTKITTPRQDVLFKKGYLSKPKPHLQRPLTSAGNSTGDGTPDHQSADGADYPENDLDNVFPYPGGAYDPSLFYVNAFDSVAGAPPVLLYDQFGNAALCYPQATAVPHTHSYQPSHQQPPNNPSDREKRYSVDSITESTTTTSPHNESNETTTTTSSGYPDEVFEGVNAFPVENSEDGEEEEEEEEGDEEKLLRKKRRRRKSVNVPEEIKSKYSVDAEEFVPRGFAPGPPQLLLVPHEVFPGAFVFMGAPVPPAHFYPTVPAPLEGVQDAATEGEAQEEEEEEQPSVGPPTQPIDIAKIVSKLEEAAREQKLLEQEQEVVPTEERKMVKETIKNDKKEINKTEVMGHPVAARYADRLKTHQPHTVPTRKLPTSATVTPPKLQRTPRARVASVAAVCPRLERTATATKQPAPTTTSSTPTATSGGDQWISVSGKKKRKSNQKQTEIPEICETISPRVEATPPETTPTPPLHALPVPEVDKVPRNKDKSIRTTNAKKITKKRIIITDGALQPAPETPPTTCSPAAQDVQQEQAGNSELGENKLTNIEIEKVPELPVVAPTPETHLIPELSTIASTPEPPKQQEHKKPKKKKNKPKVSTSIDLNLSSTDSAVSDASPGVQGAHPDDDMSLELDRMIQRGLYANLEQKLQNFNPGDSFLATLGRSAPSLGPTLSSKPSLLPFPPLILPQSPSAAAAALERSPTPPMAAPPSAGGPPGLSITQAVREWMDRTREATPEVEIFRRPQELRQDVLMAAIDDLDVVSEEELDVELQLQTSDDVDRTAMDANMLVEERSRSRSASVDLLQCWDYDVPPPAQPMAPPLVSQHQLPVDPAEDALASYESVYGQSGDFQRIQSEVLGLRSRPRARGDGGLPYRAICCTVM